MSGNNLYNNSEINLKELASAQSAQLKARHLMNLCELLCIGAAKGLANPIVLNEEDKGLMKIYLDEINGIIKIIIE